MEETKVLVMSYFSFIPNALDYGGNHEVKKRVYEEIPQNQNPLDAVRQAMILNCGYARDNADNEELFPSKEAGLPVNMGDGDSDDYIQFNVLSGLKVNGKFYVDFDQCIKAL